MQHDCLSISNLLPDLAALSVRRRPKSSIPTLSIFGYGLKTATQIQIQRDSNGKFQKVSIDVGPIGDSSVPESSAVLPCAEIHPVRQYHGTLFNDKDVKMRLKFELLHNI